MRTSLYFIFKGKAGFWAFAIIFIITGVIFAFVVPELITHAETDSIQNRAQDVSAAADLSVMSFVFRLLGWILLVPGATVFILIIVASIIKIKSPQNEGAFFWWINFTGGMMGALLFAIPSMFIYPIFLLLPENIKQQAKNTSMILPLFTIVGIIAGIAIFFIARSQYRGRPRWTGKTS